MPDKSKELLLADIEKQLAKDPFTDAILLAILDILLRHFECVVGTIHSADPSSNMLHLRAQRGIPDVILPRVQVIPIGKGMAGIAAERREPVQVCNLQTDSSGVAKPAAKETKMEGSVTVPMLVGETLCGTLGVGKPVSYEFSPEETSLLLQIGSWIGKHLNSMVNTP